jgi:hypothetical protein
VPAGGAQQRGGVLADRPHDEVMTVVHALHEGTVA